VAPRVGSGTAKAFARSLIAWQRRHGRHDLPWQNTQDPYRIWLSEIMLQQTQVATVIAYYERFLARFPTINDLARAPLDAVLEAWAGLGYYARGRNLHRCAQTLVERHGGQFPGDAESIAELPGIGRSTAAAIAVFAFGARAAILDGNVKRVLARRFAIEGFPGAAKVEARLWALADALLPDAGLASYTQALMDLGATVCTRARPACAHCPLAADCLAFAQGRQAELPAARPRKALPERLASLAILTDGKSVLLEKRPPAGIWGGLLTLPEVAPDEIDAFAARLGCRVVAKRTLPEAKHAFTHFRLRLVPLRCELRTPPRVAGEAAWRWLAFDAIAGAALPAPIARLLKGLPAKAI
jgi:A/G-specific adenine glycosylase